MPIDKIEIEKQTLLAPIYWEVGVALAQCQVFELGMGLLLHHFSCLGLIKMDVAQTTAILENEDKKTLGQLIKILKDNRDFREDFKEKLVIALHARNKLIHRIIIENTEKFNTQKARDDFIQEIKVLKAKVSEGDHVIRSTIYKLGIALDGFDGRAYTKGLNNNFS